MGAIRKCLPIAEGGEWIDRGGATSYVYDTLNRLETLTPPAAFGSGSFGFGYDALSRRTSLTRPNNVKTTYAYDNLSRLTSALHQLSGSTIDGATYTPDNAGNRTSKTDKRTNVTSNYGYDAIYELKSVTQGTTTTESYTYDPVGNRLSSLGVSPYAYNSSNELTSKPSFAYTYDLNGNTLTSVTGSNTTTYTWDFENRMASATLPGTGGAVAFKYDPFGRRIQKSFTQNSTTTTTNYLYDGANSIEEVDQNGAVLARYTRTQNIDEPLAELRSGTTSFYEADGLGSITSLSNGAGALANTYTYDSFGKLTASTGSLTNPFRYTGRESDTETGLYQYRARYYDSNVGRFASEDPIRFKAGTDFYQYSENNPVLMNDPLGLKACIWVGDVDLFSYTTNENSKNSPWVFGGSSPLSGSQGPWGGGASAPPGANPRGGLPIPRPACYWYRDHSFDEVETTLFVKNYICFETSSCGDVRIWPEFEFARRREVLGRRHWLETAAQAYDWLVSAPIYDEIHCLQLGPPNY
ncbi:MAG: RHS repeat domain-containing protein [Candidatus Acidiferrales bacterium]